MHADLGRLAWTVEGSGVYYSGVDQCRSAARGLEGARRWMGHGVFQVQKLVFLSHPPPARTCI